MSNRGLERGRLPLRGRSFDATSLRRRRIDLPNLTRRYVAFTLIAPALTPVQSRKNANSSIVVSASAAPSVVGGATGRGSPLVTGSAKTFVSGRKGASSLVVTGGRLLNGVDSGSPVTGEVYPADNLFPADDLFMGDPTSGTHVSVSSRVNPSDRGRERGRFPMRGMPWQGQPPSNRNWQSVVQAPGPQTAQGAISTSAQAQTSVVGRKGALIDQAELGGVPPMFSSINYLHVTARSITIAFSIPGGPLSVTLHGLTSVLSRKMAFSSTVVPVRAITSASYARDITRAIFVQPHAITSISFVAGRRNAVVWSAAASTFISNSRATGAAVLVPARALTAAATSASHPSGASVAASISGRALILFTTTKQTTGSVVTSGRGVTSTATSKGGRSSVAQTGRALTFIATRKSGVLSASIVVQTKTPTSGFKGALSPGLFSASVVTFVSGRIPANVALSFNVHASTTTEGVKYASGKLSMDESAAISVTAVSFIVRNVLVSGRALVQIVSQKSVANSLSSGLRATLTTATSKGGQSPIFISGITILLAAPLQKAFTSTQIDVRASISVTSIHFFGTQTRYPQVFGGTISGPTTGTVD